MFARDAVLSTPQRPKRADVLNEKSVMNENAPQQVQAEQTPLDLAAQLRLAADKTVKALTDAQIANGKDLGLWATICAGFESQNEIAKAMAILGDPMFVHDKLNFAIISAHLKHQAQHQNPITASIILRRLGELAERVVAIKKQNDDEGSKEFLSKLPPPPAIIKGDYLKGFLAFEDYLCKYKVPSRYFIELLTRCFDDPTDRLTFLTLVQKNQDSGKTWDTWLAGKKEILETVGGDNFISSVSAQFIQLKPTVGETILEYHKKVRMYSAILVTYFAPKMVQSWFFHSLPASDQYLHSECKDKSMEDTLQCIEQKKAPANIVCYIPTPVIATTNHNISGAVNKYPEIVSSQTSTPSIKSRKRPREQLFSNSGGKVETCPHCNMKAPNHSPEQCFRNKNGPNYRPNHKSKEQKWNKPFNPYSQSSFSRCIDSWNQERKEMKWKLKRNTQYRIPMFNSVKRLVEKKEELGGALLAKVTLNNFLSLKGLIDTGANVSVISSSLLKSLAETKTINLVQRKSVVLLFANNSERTCPVVTLTIQVGPKSKEHDFVVLDECSDPFIIGLDLIHHFKLLQTAAITAEEIYELLQHYKLADPEEVMQTPEDIQQHPMLDKLLQCIQLDIDQNLATFNKHSTIGTISIQLKDDNPVTGEGSTRYQGIWRDQMVLPRALEKFFEGEVLTWLREHIVEEMSDLSGRKVYLTGPFNTNAFAIVSGKQRIVHNFKPLNDQMIDDTCSVPGIDVAFTKILHSQATIFSKIDLKSAYLQIPLNEKDRDLTAFTCNGKRYRFITAPLGLKTIPSQFQRWIKALLQEHQCLDFSVNHLDDIIIFSRTVDEHIHHVKKVLAALTSKFLTISLKKCIFFATKLPALGYILEVGGLRPNTKKICNMMEWHRPNSKKRLQRLLGILNFFRRFIYNYTERVYPIMSITGRTFDWYKQLGAEEAYLDIYRALMASSAFLAFPDPFATIELATDASEHGIGAILFQVVEGKVRYLGFNSRVLKGSELRYSIPKKELISIIYHIKFYKDLLYGKTFRLHTDSEALTKILSTMDNPKKNSIISQWLAELADFNFSVHHIKGSDNFLPDMASRVQRMQVLAARPKNWKCSLTEDQIKQLLDYTHSLAHWGAVLMYRHIIHTEGIFDIPNLLQRCTEYCKACSACLRVNKYTQAYALPRVPAHWLPMEYLSADLMQLSKSKDKFEYLLVVLDLMSGFVQLKPLQSKSAEEVTDALLQMFLTFGFPKKLKTDNGGEFTNELIEDLLNKASVTHHRTIAYDHHANGEVERAIRSLRDSLKKLIIGFGEAKYRDEWEALVPLVQFGFNNKVHAITGVTPFELMFGRTGFQFASKMQNLETSQEAMLSFWESFNREIPTAIQQLKMEHQRTTRYPRKIVQFKEGDTVVHLLQQSNKQDDSYTGPYTVIKVLEHGHYLLQQEDGTQVEAPANFLKAASPVVTSEMMKPFEEEAILQLTPSPIQPPDSLIHQDPSENEVSINDGLSLEELDDQLMGTELEHEGELIEDNEEEPELVHPRRSTRPRKQINIPLLADGDNGETSDEDFERKAKPKRRRR